MTKQNKAAFTLIELLVVVTIIVVLLALLVPALDRAIYQAELAVCATRLKGIGTGAATYALDHKRYYPHRAAIDDPNIDFYPMQIVHDAAYDLRPTIESYINIRHMLLCPLTGKVDLTIPAQGAFIFSPYNLWFGWRFQGAPAMFRIGDRWAGYANDTRFDFLAGDRDRHGGARGVYGTHPDRVDLMSQEVTQNAPILGLAGGLTQSRWVLINNEKRSQIDMNMVSESGAVTRYTNFAWDDPRHFKVPDNAKNSRPGWFNYLPGR